MFKRIKFVGIPLSDQDKALAFGKDKLGFQVVTDQPMGPGLRWIELRLPATQTCIALFTPPGHESRIDQFTELSFGCDDVERVYQELVARGVEFTQPPKKDRGAPPRSSRAARPNPARTLTARPARVMSLTLTNS